MKATEITERVILYKNFMGEWKEYRFVPRDASLSVMRKALSRVKRDIALNGQAAIFHKPIKHNAKR